MKLLRQCVVALVLGCQAQAALNYLPIQPLPLNGERVTFAERDGKPVGEAWRTPANTTRVRILIGEPAERQDFEKSRLSGAEVGLKGYQRAHAVGPGLGVESPYGILLAPDKVNLVEQNWRIEDNIREIYKQRRPGIALVLTVDVSNHEFPSRLKEAVYRVDAYERGEVARTVYWARVTIGNEKVDPKIDVQERFLSDALERSLRTTKDVLELKEKQKREAQIQKLEKLAEDKAKARPEARNSVDPAPRQDILGENQRRERERLGREAEARARAERDRADHIRGRPARGK